MIFSLTTRRINKYKYAHGYTLVELCIVVSIICILATGSIFVFTGPTAKVKGVMFNLLTDMNFARSESVSRNQDILVDFILGERDGYLICFDADRDRDCQDEPESNIVRKVLFRKEVQ